jgi:DNA-binding beta-propeller fold protein YncE
MLSANPSPQFEEVVGWGPEPAVAFHDVADVAIGPDDRVYMLTRGPNAVSIYEADGTALASWGEGEVSARCHGIGIAPDGDVVVVDMGDNTVKRFTADGDLKKVFGTAGVGSDSGVDESLADYFERQKSIRRGAGPFNGPTKAAFAPDGTMFVSDGYRNASVHRFSPDGELELSWGAPGSAPGEFRNPHYVALSGDNHVVVADRENFRLQVFDFNGQLQEIFADIQRPCGVASAPDGTLCVSELETLPEEGDYSFTREVSVFLPGRFSVLDGGGQVLYREPLPPYRGSMTAPNGVAVDSHGDVYIPEVPYAMYARRRDMGEDCRAIHKFRRV